LEEKGCHGEFLPISEDEHGTYIMNSKDLRAVEHVERLVRIGVNSLKIEGRTKSHYYAARSAQVYRQAIDDAVAGRPFNPMLMTELEGLANRGYTDGFYQRHPSEELQNYRHSSSQSMRQLFVGEVLEEREGGLTLVDVKNKFALGDSLILLTPTGNHSFTLDRLQDQNGNAMEVAPGAGYTVLLNLPAKAGERGLIVRMVA
jgi:putative protease